LCGNVLKPFTISSSVTRGIHVEHREEHPSFVAAGLVAVMVAGIVLATGRAHAGGNGYGMSGNMPDWVPKAQNPGATDSMQTLTLTVWLKLHLEHVSDMLLCFF